MNTKSLTLLFYVIILGLGITGCSNKDSMNPGNETPPISTIDFLAVNDSIKQTDDSVVVNLKLNRRATTDGHVSVRFSGDAVHGQEFTTKPVAVNGIITLQLSREMQSAQFVIFRSGRLQHEKTLNLILENPTNGFKLGNQVSASLRLTKQIEPVSKINFSDVFIHISEPESNGYEIQLNLTGSITNTENLFIELTDPPGTVYGTHYSTNPAAIQHELKLGVVPGQNIVSFKIIPVNDNLIRGNYEVVFRIKATTGPIQPGTFTELIVRVEEDDQKQAVVHSIAELKTQFSEHDGQFWLGNDYYIEGTITSGSNVTDNKTVYIQDETGGIMLKFTVQNFLKLGDMMQLNLKGGSGKTINGQKAITDVADMLGIKLKEDQTVVPVIVTFEQLATGNYEGKRVRIADVTFTEANGTTIFEGNRQISAGTSRATVTTYPGAPFRNNILPAGKLSVSGVVGDWGHLLPQVYAADILK